MSVKLFNNYLSAATYGSWLGSEYSCLYYSCSQSGALASAQGGSSVEEAELVWKSIVKIDSVWHKSFSLLL
jgi:hypothetical protein